VPQPANLRFTAACTAVEKNGLRMPSKPLRVLSHTPLPPPSIISEEKDTEKTWIRILKYLEIKLREGIIQTSHMMWN